MSVKEPDIREALSLFCDGLDAVVTKLRQDLHMETKKAPYDITKIKWEWRDSKSKPGQKYEASEDVDSLDFKALLKYLQEKSGKATLGDYFYWVFKNGTTIGRSPKRSGSK